jgi:hypothetical protein
MSGALFWLIALGVVPWVALIGVGCLPLSMWRSTFEPAPAAPTFVPPVVDSRKRGKKKGSAVQPA